MATLQESAFLEPSKLPAPGRASHLLGGCLIHNEVLIAIREKFNLPSISIERGVQMQNDWLPVRRPLGCTASVIPGAGWQKSRGLRGGLWPATQSRSPDTQMTVGCPLRLRS